MDNLRVGLAGIGRHGMRYANHIINDIDGMELAYFSRESKNSTPDLLKGVKKVKDITRKDIDLMIIATPTDTHYDLITRGLKKGLNILVEKPVAGNLQQCSEILEMQRKSKSTLTVAQTLRYTPVLKHLKDILKEKGPVRWFEIVQSLEPPKTPWLLEERAMGGCVLNTGVHVFDTINWLLGDIRTITCTTERTFNPVWEDYAYGDMTLKGGLEGSFKISRNTENRSRYIRVDLEEGFLWADSLSCEFFHVNDGVMNKEIIEGDDRTLVSLLNDMTKVLRGKIEPPITGLDGIKAVSAAMACYESNMTNNETRLKSYQ